MKMKCVRRGLTGRGECYVDLPQICHCRLAQGYTRRLIGAYHPFLEHDPGVSIMADIPLLYKYYYLSILLLSNEIETRSSPESRSMQKLSYYSPPEPAQKSPKQLA
jgi:hypothetical protein